VQDSEANSDFHCVHFFEPSQFPAAPIADFLRQGLKRREGAILISSLNHAAQIESKIEEQGLNVQQMIDIGLWVVTDIDDLIRDLESGLATSKVVETLIELVIRPTQERSVGGRIRIYGELEDAIFSRLKNAEAALEVERYGNRLVAEGDTKIYCCYSTSAFPDASFAKPFMKLCHLHDRVHNGLKDREDWRFQLADKMATP
jgi:MEDS: MEthanogen/methylotroph, DcmR Sensory domain